MRHMRNASSVLAPGITGLAEKEGCFRRHSLPTSRNAFFYLVLLLFSSVALFGQTTTGKILVHSKFGGQILGFDIDQNGTEGLLSEAKTLPSGQVQAAVETFDQGTGIILKVVQETETQDDFITMGIVGNSVGLVEREHVIGFDHVQRTFQVLNPLDPNQFTGVWTPPLGSQHIIMPTGVSRSQGVPNVAVFAYDNSDQFIFVQIKSAVLSACGKKKAESL